MATHWLGLVDQLVYAKTFCIDQLQKLLVRLQFLWCIHDCTVFCFSASVTCAIKIKFYLLYFYFLLMQLFATGC